MTSELLDLRYGGAAPATTATGNEVIPLLLRHRSVRSFTEEGIDDETMTAIVAAAQSAATSSNMQAWSVVEVRDAARKDALSRLAGDQAFIREAPVFLVFVADWARHRAVASHRGEPADGVDYMESTLVGVIDAALAAQNATVAAESLGLGAVYVGAVRNAPEAISDLLELPRGAFPVMGMALGHPDPRDRAGIKPRLPQSVVRHRETYRASPDETIGAYDHAVREYYCGQGAARGWIETIVGRIRSGASLRGRDGMRASLERRGLPSR
ncbi:NADPH-dependent oxidoreductase [Microbacterium limosum]|uniref:NADPH-dependent oxidoreductase n=1 Tax=Microbacterium limosum TaxID=3079935 RepID=A0AAU0MHM5_9MICO|nr:NADPH-dependent oxidoreductase [Microbacterium sp. Y20]WOQ69967.1 NADPH-dependent oxidoreductase [Microbacterium sp. Y20]